MINQRFGITLFLIALFLAPAAEAHAQSDTSVFTYQGRVTDNGTNFNGAGEFKFALVTSTNANHGATATATVAGGMVSAISIVAGGNGYVTAPRVNILGGGGSGAAATATISGGVVTGVTINSSGSGYTNVPIVSIDLPPPDISYTTYWSNDGTSVNGSEPTTAVHVPVADGLFTVLLGDTTLPGMAALEASLLAQPNLQLRIWFNDGANGFAALNPAQPLTPSPSAVFADSARTATGLSGLTVRQNSAGAPNIIGGSTINYVANGVLGATIAGGGATNYYGQIDTNSVSANFGTVSGGAANKVTGIFGTIGGGFENVTLDLPYSTIGGGYGNQVSAGGSTIGGGYQNLASGGDSVVAGGEGNMATNLYATVCGGYHNVAGGAGAFVGGGGFDGSYRAYSSNYALGNASVIGGGFENRTTNDYTTVGGGEFNYAYNTGATVAGGISDQAGGSVAVVCGGNANDALGDESFIGGGYNNAAGGAYSVVPGGEFNDAGGKFSFAAGRYANAGYDGCFVWSDSQGSCYSDRTNQFKIRAGGGVEMDVNGSSGLNPAALKISSTSTNGVGLWVSQSSSDAVAVFGNASPGTGDIIKGFSGTYANNLVFEVQNDGTVRSKGVVLTSDRNAKAGFSRVNAESILEKVAALPITEWHYKDDSAGIRHVGPMAQDFHAAFHLNGKDNKHISVVDEGGVALAAIQGLNEKLDKQAAQLKTRDAQIARLQKSVIQLRKLVEQLSNAQANVR